MSDTIKKQPPKLDRYVDPTGEFSTREFKLATWYVKHKLLLRKIFVGFLVVWCFASIGYSFGNLILYLTVGYSQDQVMYVKQVQETQNYDELKVLYAPQGLQVKNVSVYSSASDKYDLSATVINPNSRFIANLKYRFTYASGQTEIRETTLMPLEIRPVIYFGVESALYINAPKLVIEKTEWRKISTHSVKNVANFISERKMFDVENFVFTSASELGADTSRVEFDLTNNSNFGFYQPEFYIELYDGGVVGYLYIIEDKFKTGETRHIDVRSFVPNLRVQDIKVYTILNVFEQAQYMAVE